MYMLIHRTKNSQDILAGGETTKVEWLTVPSLTHYKNTVIKTVWYHHNSQINNGIYYRVQKKIET